MSKINTFRLKSWPQFFNQLIIGNKKFELRKNDRDFKVGDKLILEEYIPDSKEYTGRKAECNISYITSADSPCAFSKTGLKNGYCILSVEFVSMIEELEEDKSLIEVTCSYCSNKTQRHYTRMNEDFICEICRCWR